MYIIQTYVHFEKTISFKVLCPHSRHDYILHGFFLDMCFIILYMIWDGLTVNFTPRPSFNPVIKIIVKISAFLKLIYPMLIF
jgi:hypothetical protein